MDLQFQRSAFLQLDEELKKEMLIHSKLNDELALQSVGIVNLTVRSNRDKLSHKEVKINMRKTEQKVGR